MSFFRTTGRSCQQQLRVLKLRPKRFLSTEPAKSTSSTAPTVHAPLPKTEAETIVAKRKPSAYTRAHQKHPYITQTITSLFIYLLGDITAQRLVPTEPEPFDFYRTARALIIGGLAAVPGYRWFLWLATSFNYSSKILSLGIKVLINQMIFTPLFNTYFFGMQRLLTGGGWDDIKKRVVETVPTSWVNSWKIWPAVMAFNFTYIPLQFRSIFAGGIAIGWQTYLSFLNQKAANNEGAPERQKSVGQKI